MYMWAVAPLPIARNVLLRLRGGGDNLPLPRPWARLMVAGSIDIAPFLELGGKAFECIRQTLEKNGTPLGSLRDVLDFGCGCGRVLRYWHGYPDKRIYGIDIDEYLVSECRRCVPFATVSKNTLEGKFPYADRSFDLVYAFSVFTHLDIAAQRAWLSECRRILRPGGILLFSVHGRAFSDRLSKGELEEFDAGKPVVRLGKYPGGNLCSTYHPERYVRTKMVDGFEFVDAVSQGAKGNPPQDLYMFRRPT